MSGIESYGFDGSFGEARGDLVQERIALLKETGDGAPDEVHRAITTLVGEIEKLGNQARPDDLDPVEDAAAPSPYDDPERGLREYWEENCDGVYTEEFSSSGQGENEDVIDNQIWLRNEFITDGTCDRLAEVYSTASDLMADLISDCSTGSLDDAYKLVGGGVTGPDTADAVIETGDGTTFETTVVKDDGSWKLWVS
ncbi:hypothetical protein [Nocardioides pelophilus]|uniref:hypothetical protein n=1 Tax=Nocardioides pelophilus TaxID=2172019 RepID=UPI001602B40E|nr:hypothetical protein [Nocardioides pelophilus]